MNHPHTLNPVEGRSELDFTPHSMEAEQALLGMIMLDNEEYHRVSGIVKPCHFYNPMHLRLFEVAGALIEQGRVADGKVLGYRFQQDEDLKMIGGVTYIAELIAQAPPSGADVRGFAQIIYDTAIRRELRRLGGAIVRQAEELNCELDPDEQIEEAEQHLFTLAEKGTASRMPVSILEASAQAIDAIADASKRTDGMIGVTTGISSVDDLLGGLVKSRLYVLAGRPGMGKSALGVNIALSAAERAHISAEDITGAATSIYSLEMDQVEIGKRMLSSVSDLSSERITRGQIGHDEFERLRDAADRIGMFPLSIDPRGGLTLDQLCASARRQKRLSGLGLVVVDYLQLIDGTQGRRGENKVAEVTRISQKLKALAKELDIPVLALAQLSRQVEQRENKRPILSDLRESGAIEQDADVVMFLYREEYYLAREEPPEDTAEHADWKELMRKAQGRAELIIDKNRHGKKGKIDLFFRARTTTFRDAA